jgi:hypothetical protein
VIVLGVQAAFFWLLVLFCIYVLVVFNQIVGADFFLESTYLLRMEGATGWDAMSNWHTVFPWLAPDFKFFLAGAMFSIFACVYAVVFKEAVRFCPSFSILLLCALTLELVFIPANNQLLHAPEAYMATVIIFLLWLFLHEKYNFVSQ